MDSTCTASTLMNWFAVWEARESEGGAGGMLLGCPAGELKGGGVEVNVQSKWKYVWVSKYMKDSWWLRPV